MKIAYKAINSEGKTFSGTIEAASPREAARTLQRQGITPLTLQEKATGSAISWRRRRLSAEILLVFISQLVSLLESSIAIDETLAALEETETNITIKKACGQILHAVRSGTSFSTALESAGLPLPSYFYLLAQSGEITGDLGKAMHSGLQQWEYDLEVRKRFIGALIYPSILIFTGISAIVLIFLLVVPRFESILGKSEQKIPLITKIILVPGSFFNDHLLLVTAAGLAFIGGGLLLARNSRIRQSCFQRIAELPLLSGWLQEIELGKWATMMATLLGCKVELTNALDLAAQFISVQKMQNHFQQLTRAVRSGTSLSAAIADKQIMPATAVNLIRVGERTGDLAGMLTSLARLTENSIKNRTNTILALIEPVAILLIGSIIGLIMAGLIMGIININEAI